jgi:hypothetical protein
MAGSHGGENERIIGQRRGSALTPRDKIGKVRKKIITKEINELLTVKKSIGLDT